MGLDWFTFGAQVVNFLILIGLLWHFAYKPILRAMNEREASIRDRLDEADRKQEQAEQRSRELEQQHDEREAQREQLLAEARADAEQRRKELVREARERVGRREAEWRDGVQRQQDELADKLQRSAGRHVVAATRRVLSDMANAELAAQMANVLERRLHESDGGTLEELQKVIAAANGSLRIVSTPELPESQRAQLRHELTELVGEAIEPEFAVDDSLICGVELRVGDYRVGWSASDYLAELREHIERAVSSASEHAGDERTSGDDAAGAEETSDEGQNKGD